MVDGDDGFAWFRPPDRSRGLDDGSGSGARPGAVRGIRHPLRCCPTARIQALLERRNSRIASTSLAADHPEETRPVISRSFAKGLAGSIARGRRGWFCAGARAATIGKPQFASSLRWNLPIRRQQRSRSRRAILFDGRLVEFYLSIQATRLHQGWTRMVRRA